MHTRTYISVATIKKKFIDRLIVIVKWSWFEILCTAWYYVPLCTIHTSGVFLQVAQQVNYAKNLFNEIKQTLPPAGASSAEALSPV